MYKDMNFKIRKQGERWLIVAIGIFLLIAAQSCEDFVTIPGPDTQLDQAKVFEDDATALSALSSIYFKMSENIQGFASGSSSSGLTIFTGTYADELTSYLSPQSAGYEFYFNNVTPTNSLVSTFWSNAYKIIYECNRVIEGVYASTKMTTAAKAQITGEAFFIRAFTHFYLVNMFGDVPLVKTSDYAVTAKVSRTPIENVYAGIIADLQEAKQLLADEYPSDGRVRANRGAATALLARTYLYLEEYAAAELESAEIINNNAQYVLEENLDDVFLNSSDEAIWQIQPAGGLIGYTYEAAAFLLKAQPTSYALRNSLVASFEKNDKRKKQWIDSVNSDSGLTTWYFAFKYKENHLNRTFTEESMVLRLAEVILIRAEARAKQTGKLSLAIADVNEIRDRAGISSLSAASGVEETLQAIELERRHELFTEWGHRFLDLKRTGKLDAVLGPLKTNWSTTDSVLPLPQNELTLNQNLEPQNPGY
jgi:hypothetical protein